MSQAQFISVNREGGIQLLVEGIGNPDVWDIEHLRDIMRGKVDL